MILTQPHKSLKNITVGFVTNIEKIECRQIKLDSSEDCYIDNIACDYCKK